LKVAVDATYAIGDELSGVGIYSKEILHGLSSAHPEQELLCCYRPHRFFRALLERLPKNCHRRPLWERRAPRSVALFHGLNQRLPGARFRRAVSTFHDLFVLTAEYSSAEFRRRFARQARRAAERSDLIIAVSQFTATQVSALLGVESARLRVIPHGVRIPPIRPRRPRERMILHVGAIQRRKNVQRLVLAFEQVSPEWRLVLAGSSGFGAGEILDQIRVSPRRKEIEVLGYVPAGELADLYSRAGIFAFPSQDEGFGMPVLEAMAWGVPVVASNRSALPEVCGDAAILVDPLDTEDIAHALRTLMEDRLLGERLVERGLKRAATFPWARAVEETWQVYRELLD